MQFTMNPATKRLCMLQLEQAKLIRDFQQRMEAINLESLRIVQDPTIYKEDAQVLIAYEIFQTHNKHVTTDNKVAVKTFNLKGTTK